MTGTPAPEGAESITEDELTAALIHVEHSGGKRYCSSCREKAVSLLSHVRGSLEPEYEPGTLVIDDVGDVYRRCNEMAREMPWLGFGGHLHAESAPVRPLRKLVPLPSHDELVAVLVESITHDVHGYEGQAQRVLTLMEGGSDD